MGKHKFPGLVTPNRYVFVYMAAVATSCLGVIHPVSTFLTGLNCFYAIMYKFHQNWSPTFCFMSRRACNVSVLCACVMRACVDIREFSFARVSVF